MGELGLFSQVPRKTALYKSFGIFMLELDRGEPVKIHASPWKPLYYRGEPVKNAFVYIVSVLAARVATLQQKFEILWLFWTIDLKLWASIWE